VDDVDGDPRGALVYAEATRVLDGQLASLANIQDRAGILLSAASISTSFLAALALRESDRLSTLNWFAVAAFLVVVVVCVALLAPIGRWTFRFNVKALVQNCLEANPPPSLAKMHHDLSIQMDRWNVANGKKLYMMLKSFQVAGLALGVEVAFWIADLF
jgi:hypothetical protein